MVKEELVVSKQFQKIQKRFQDKVFWFNKDPFSHKKFWPDDIDIAARFLNKTFPEIRQLFQLKYQAKTRHQESFNETIVDKLFDLFINTQYQLFRSAKKMINQSIDGLLLDKESKCYKKLS